MTTRIGDHTLHEGRCIVYEYDRELDVRNIDQLPRGRGLRYLEVLPILESGQWVYIAKRWRRSTTHGAAFIDFKPKGGAQ